MKQSELIKVVRGFRRGILDGRQSRHMCVAVCLPLQGYLSFLGVKSKIMEGETPDVNHVWLRLSDGTIIDPTAHQFPRPDGGKMPAVYVGPQPEWYGQWTPRLFGEP